ncbi:hypothetical protein KC340_g12663 [Hortaea werneckii]|nr:hypothetical protein KC342_g12933 [Hortaea werneckii]KAI7073963.1 hypothetical protein KC339_g14145 [Hortaea werneckii]KAI7225632.1 hypothetical protein KC365_g9870 [Hortaea werneckii]KAI7302764.1 hypothetical protein KC340_g12663 [Hortaea werneckii]KAI7389610.1 hypothetical protein KC328_g8364 [Hortaea werneckii]
MTIAPADRGVQVVIIYSFFAALTTITISLRVYCRIYIQKALGWDDWAAFFAWVFFIIFASCAITGAHHGTGQHAWNIQPPEELPVGLKFWWLCEPFFVISNMAIKASIGIMLLRLCVNRTHTIVIWTVLVITQLYSLFFFFIFLFQCLPSAYFWTQYTGGEGSCMNTNIVVGVFYGYSAITCAGDWTFSILPVFLVWNLQMGRKEKISVVMILAVGALASIATVARIPYVHTLRDKADFLYATTEVALWSCVETALGITAACAATLRPLFRQMMPWVGFASSRNRSHGLTSQSHGDNSRRLRRRGRDPYGRTPSANNGENEFRMEGLGHPNSKGFGTLTTAWHANTREEGDEEVGSNSSKTMIITTNTSVY